MKPYHTLLIMLLCLSVCPDMVIGQEHDATGQSGIAVGDTTKVPSKKELKKLKTAKRNVHYNILGGPSYSPDMGILIGGSSLVTFRMNPKDTAMKRSVIPASIAVMISGGVSIMVKPQLFFKDDKFRIFGQFHYKNIKENYYGVGYETNKNFERGKETSQYRYNGAQINPWFLFRIKKSNFFAGPQIDINYDNMRNVAPGILNDVSYIRAGGTVEGYKNLSSGIGIMLSYDTRDVPANPYKGLYLDIKGIAYQKWLGSDNNYSRIELDYRQYKSVGKRKVLAWTVQSKNVFGNNIPLNKYVLSGTPFDLRGYYMGQFRDKSSHVAVIEYRQMFNTNKSNWFKRMASHLGYVVWGGAGAMGPGPAKIEGVLPNAGIGLRVEVQPRMNVRLDIGRDFISKQNLFYFNMTEAF